jgi:hypothetical protein
LHGRFKSIQIEMSIAIAIANASKRQTAGPDAAGR